LDGTIYFASADGYLYAFGPDGTQKWRFRFLTEGLDSTPAIGPDGTIYLGGSGAFVEIRPNGTLKWEYDIGGLYFVGSSPAIGPDGTIYFADSGGFLYALNSDGSLKWKYLRGGGNWDSSPAIGSDGTIYIGGFGSLHAVDPNGTRKWVYEFTTQEDVHSSPAIGQDGTIYISTSRNLYAITPKGSLDWNYTKAGSWSSPALGSDPTIYSQSLDGHLYALSPDGHLEWDFNDCQVQDYCVYFLSYSSPTIGGDGTLYVGSPDHKLYAVDPTGSVRWTYTTGDVVASSPSIGSDGTLYLGSNDNNLYSFYGPPPDQPPTASFKFTPTTPVKGQAVSFDGSASIDPDGTIINYSWSFGDGTPPSPGVTATHSYLTAGTYQVILTVTDNAGQIGTKKEEVTVAPLLVQLNVGSDPPGCNVQGGGDYLGGANATLTASDSCNGRVFSQWTIDKTSAATTNGKLVSTYSLVMNQDHNATAVYLSQADWTDFTDKMEKILDGFVNLDNLYGYIDAARGGLTSEQQDLVVDADTAQTVKGLSYVGFVLSFVVTLAPIYAIEQNDTMPQDQKEQALIHILGEQLSTLICTAAVAAMTGGIAAFVGKAACGYFAASLYDMAEPYLAGFGQWVSGQLSSIFDTAWKDFQKAYHMLGSLYRNVITFIIGSETTVYIIDSSGRRLGEISASGQYLHEIPDSAYSGIGTYPQRFIIANPLTDNYKIHVTNLQDGPVHFGSTTYSNWAQTGSTEYVQTLSKGDFDYTFNPQTITFLPPPGPWWTSPLVIAVAIAAAGAMITIAVWRLPNRMRKMLTLSQKSNLAFSMN